MKQTKWVMTERVEKHRVRLEKKHGCTMEEAMHRMGDTEIRPGLSSKEEQSKGLKFKKHYDMWKEIMALEDKE